MHMERLFFGVAIGNCRSKTFKLINKKHRCRKYTQVTSRLVESSSYVLIFKIQAIVGKGGHTPPFLDQAPLF